MAGLHVSNVKLEDVRVICFGAGSAGTGIADQISDAIASEAGIDKGAAMKQIWYAFYTPSSACTDSPGASTNKAYS